MKHGLIILFVIAFAWGCSTDGEQVVVDDDDNPPTVNTTTCIGCHSSEEALKASVDGAGTATLARGPEVQPPGMSDG